MVFIGIRLVPEFYNIGNRLAPDWHQIGTRLVRDWYQIRNRLVPHWYQMCTKLVPDCSHAVGACHPRGLPPVVSTICGAYCHIRNRTSNHPSHPTQQLRAPDSNSWQGLWKLVSTCVEACGTSSTRACLASSTRVERFQEVLNGFPKASRRFPERLSIYLARAVLLRHL